MVQRVSITSIMTGILLLAFFFVSWALFNQLSNQSPTASTAAQTIEATAVSPYTSAPTLNTQVTWNKVVYSIQNSNSKSAIQVAQSLGITELAGKKVPVSAIAGVASSKEILVAWGAYYYLAIAQ